QLSALEIPVGVPTVALAEGGVSLSVLPGPLVTEASIPRLAGLDELGVFPAERRVAPFPVVDAVVLAFAETRTGADARVLAAYLRRRVDGPDTEGPERSGEPVADLGGQRRAPAFPLGLLLLPFLASPHPVFHPALVAGDDPLGGGLEQHQ